jgi:hypothetical protein
LRGKSCAIGPPVSAAPNADNGRLPDDRLAG